MKTKIKTKNNSPLESTEQKKVFAWIRANQIKYPKLQLAYGTLNGVRLTPRLRGEMKAQGNRVGVPDIVLPAKSFTGAFPGLYIELKRVKGGRVSKEQLEYMGLLLDQGYLAQVCLGHEAAIYVIRVYLEVI